MPRRSIFFFLSICFVLLTISFVLADVGIYTPIGKPQITDLSYSIKGVDESGLDLTVKNIGEESGNFQITLSCTNGWEVYSFGGYNSNFQLAAGDTKQVRIPLSCSGEDSCYTSVNCEVTVEDSFGSFVSGEELKDTKKIGFQAQKSSYCGTSYQICRAEQKICGYKDGEAEAKLIQKCSQYCNRYETEKVCDYKCEFQDGEPRCLSLDEEKSRERKTQVLSWIFGLVVVGGLAYLLFGVKKRKNK